MSLYSYVILTRSSSLFFLRPLILCLNSFYSFVYSRFSLLMYGFLDFTLLPNQLFQRCPNPKLTQQEALENRVHLRFGDHDRHPDPKDCRFFYMCLTTGKIIIKWSKSCFFTLVCKVL